MNHHQFDPRLERRHRRARIWLLAFQMATIVGIIALTALIINVLNSSFGYVAVENTIDPASLAVEEIPLEDLPKETWSSNSLEIITVTWTASSSQPAAPLRRCPYRTPPA